MYRGCTHHYSQEQEALGSPRLAVTVVENEVRPTAAKAFEIRKFNALSPYSCRWLKADTAAGFYAFSGGARHCPGQSFAIQEMKVWHCSFHLNSAVCAQLYDHCFASKQQS